MKHSLRDPQTQRFVKATIEDQLYRNLAEWQNEYDHRKTFKLARWLSHHRLTILGYAGYAILCSLLGLVGGYVGWHL